MKKNVSVEVKWLVINVVRQNQNDYISLTDIARYKNPDEPKDVVKNWMRSRNTIEYLWLRETINNEKFKQVEFEGFKNEA